MEGYLIINEQGEMLLWTARHREADCVLAFSKLKGQEWPELRAEGYRTARVVITDPAAPMPWEALREVDDPDDPEVVIGMEPDDDWL